MNRRFAISHIFYPHTLLLLLQLSCLVSAARLSHLGRRTDPQTTVVATVTISSPAVTASPDSSSYTNAADLQESVLNSTNFYRYEHNATALTWNSSLATYAAQWADHCKWKHSGGPNGENLAEGYPNVVASVDAWGNERAQYNFQDPTGFTEATGHFTQLVWKSTTSTGCAAVNCTGKGGMDGFFLVCEYYPPGNIVGDNNIFFEQNVQSQIHTTGPTATSSATSTTGTASTSASSTGGANYVGNEGISSRSVNGLWACAVGITALALAGGMI